MGLNLAEIQQKLDRLIQNMSEQNRRAYQIFYDPTPQDVELPQLDENDNLVNVTIPNRAKILADFEAWRESARREYNVLLEYPVLYVDPVDGNDSNSGISTSQALKSLEEAYRRCLLGRHTRIVIRGSGDATNPTVVKMPPDYLGGFTYVFGVTPDWSSLSDGSDILITDNGEENRRLGFIWGRHLLFGVSIEASAGYWAPVQVYGAAVGLYKCKVINKISNSPVIRVGTDSGGGFLRLNTVELSNEGGSVGINMKAPSMCYGFSVTFDSNISTNVQKEDANLCVTNL